MGGATRDCDLLVVGGGAGGIGAAAAAAAHGADVVLLERLDELGGTAGPGGVCAWEAGIGGTGVPVDLYRRLRARGPRAVGIYGLARHCCAPDPARRDFPGGENRLRPDRRYADTLRRWGGADEPGYPYALYREHCFGVCFTPAAYEAACRELLVERGVALRPATAVAAVEVAGGSIRSVTTTAGDRIRPRCVVDATGTAAVAGLAGCRLRHGREGRDEHGESLAPERGDDQLNAASLIYVVAPRDRAAVDPLPEGIPAGCWWADRFPLHHAVEQPDGTWQFNPLPIMAGRETEDLGEAALPECRRRVRSTWHHVQTNWPEFRRFAFRSAARMLGVRDAPRVVCRHTLTQGDLQAGLAGDAAHDRVALADHLMDVHGAGHLANGRLPGPYGIPYGCLLAAGVDNLLVASRGAGFSAMAASSARLTRTVMQLGQAAGTAAALALRRGVVVGDLPVPELQARLRADGVQLDQPLSGEARRRVDTADAPSLPQEISS